ncbi:4-hydroxy-tetrahydrodipicolinate synthase [Rhodanobacter glycinis]|jgi:4-hydroxy-tetrahydrodipicolinate synthase|uniref:4-hydroxy-tetrahydrodipicolinate synthase n=1 Tax=Rhodanobacter glycinis TaxID=582702 RepID=A0A1I3XRH3_9GAMM|nr:4-hydroxy-tetrahydrodipicolinate synthase [Rhodanobacter glycinis]TAM16679.1 MAG: 4-hydroxy-tetrahydrodipicolinate synthase [Rhodanobacter sp.]SFK22257.1 dihydrodipicolinate synthase [Rhodanobacter glycinis]
MNIRGSICALATPFGAGGALDLAAFGRLLDYQIEGGTQALVVAGSTGEAHMLEHDEFGRLLAFAVKHVAGRVPVIAGTGEAGTAKTVAATRHARELGADAALVVAPYYVRPTQEGMRRHFLEVAEHGGLPVLLYNVPGRTACDIDPATVAQLREHPAIIGIKEARGDAERIHALAELVRPDFVYLSGDDATAGEAMLAGAAGTISVVANLVPKAFRALCDAATGGDQAATARCRMALDPLLQALECAPNPIAVKAGLPELGLGSATPRLPLVELEEGPARARLRTELATLASLANAA